MPKKPDSRYVSMMTAVYDEAITEAILNGMGLIRINYVNGDLEFQAVSSAEYRDMAEALIWASNHTKEVPIQ